MAHWTRSLRSSATRRRSSSEVSRRCSTSACATSSSCASSSRSSSPASFSERIACTCMRWREATSRSATSKKRCAVSRVNTRRVRRALHVSASAPPTAAPRVPAPPARAPPLPPSRARGVRAPGRRARAATRARAPRSRGAARPRAAVRACVLVKLIICAYVYTIVRVYWAHHLRSTLVRVYVRLDALLQVLHVASPLVDLRSKHDHEVFEIGQQLRVLVLQLEPQSPNFCPTQYTLDPIVETLIEKTVM